MVPTEFSQIKPSPRCTAHSGILHLGNRRSIADFYLPGDQSGPAGRSAQCSAPQCAREVFARLQSQSTAIQRGACKEKRTGSGLSRRADLSLFKSRRAYYTFLRSLSLLGVRSEAWSQTRAPGLDLRRGVHTASALYCWGRSQSLSDVLLFCWGSVAFRVSGLEQGGHLSSR